MRTVVVAVLGRQRNVKVGDDVVVDGEEVAVVGAGAVVEIGEAARAHLWARAAA